MEGAAYWLTYTGRLSLITLPHLILHPPSSQVHSRKSHVLNLTHCTTLRNTCRILYVDVVQVLTCFILMNICSNICATKPMKLQPELCVQEIVVSLQHIAHEWCYSAVGFSSPCQLVLTRRGLHVTVRGICMSTRSQK